MVSKIKKIGHKILPDSIDKFLKEVYFSYKLKRIYTLQKNAKSKIREKKNIKIAFFIFKESVWKFDQLYHLLQKDNRFEPIVVICPYNDFGEKDMLTSMRKAYDYFVLNNYNVIKTFNEETREWLDIKKKVNPDIIFFSAPWYFTRPEYQIENYKDRLTCYVPYTFVISYLYQGYFNQYMQNFVWKFFVETDVHKKISIEYSRNKGINAVVTGYPGMDKLINYSFNSIDVWKIKDRKIKRIIWSPHHTLPGMGATLDFSTFFMYNEFMLQMANNYKDRIQIAFKPHPTLKSKLYLDDIWGKTKTDEYFQKWENLYNGQLVEGDYIDLFATSDGMINDSSAFVIEYLYTQKPQLFLTRDDRVSERLNEVGKMALTIHYLGKCKEDIEDFINNIILNEQDIMCKERVQFFESKIKPPNNLTASENIFNYLASEIFESAK